MHCFKTEETLFEGAAPFHAKTNPTAQILKEEPDAPVEKVIKLALKRL